MTGNATHPHPDTLRLCSDPQYRPPDYLDVRAALDALDYTDVQVALLVGAKDDRNVRLWKAGPECSRRAQIHYPTWRLILQESGLVKPSKPFALRKLLFAKSQGKQG